MAIKKRATGSPPTIWELDDQLVQGRIIWLAQHMEQTRFALFPTIGYTHTRSQGLAV